MACLAPARSSYDSADLLLKYSIPQCQLGLFNPTPYVDGSDLRDLIFGQLAHAMARPSVVRRTMASLRDRVPLVIARCTQKPVLVVVARWIVASVADPVAVWNRADSVDVAPACTDSFKWMPVGSVSDSIPEESVLRSLHAVCPEPAFIGSSDGDFGPVLFQPGEALMSTHNELEDSSLDGDDEGWLA